MTDFSPVPPPAARQPALAADMQTNQTNQTNRETRARDAALRLEASFLSEMLKSAGVGKQVREFSGGTGEEQFASFQRDAIARKMAASGGIGLAEHFFRTMMEAQDDR